MKKLISEFQCLPDPELRGLAIKAILWRIPQTILFIILAPPLMLIGGVGHGLIWLAEKLQWLTTPAAIIAEKRSEIYSKAYEIREARNEQEILPKETL